MIIIIQQVTVLQKANFLRLIQVLIIFFKHIPLPSCSELNRNVDRVLLWTFHSLQLRYQNVCSSVLGKHSLAGWFTIMPY